MAISSLVLSAVSYLAGSISKSKGGKTAGDEFSEALWNWVRPIFIKDDEPLEELKAKPDDSNNQTMVALKVEKFLEKNEGEVKTLQDILAKLKGSESKKAGVNITQTHFGSGDNVGGNKIVKG